MSYIQIIWSTPVLKICPTPLQNTVEIGTAATKKEESLVHTITHTTLQWAHVSYYGRGNQ